MKPGPLTAKMCLALIALLQVSCVSMELGGSEDRVLNYVLSDARPTMTPRTEALPTSLIIQDLGGDPLASSLSMAYSLAPNQREFYQLSRWAERPVSALTRLLQQRLGARAAFQSVAALGDGVGGDFGLGIAIESIYHDATSSPGSVRLQVRADLIRRSSRELTARQVFFAETGLEVAGPAGVADAMSLAVADVFDALIPWLEAEVFSEL